MEQHRLFDSMNHKDVDVQIVFPMFSEIRFVQASSFCTIDDVLRELVRLDDQLFHLLNEEWIVFDQQGFALDRLNTLDQFGECEWIQLFVC